MKLNYNIIIPKFPKLFVLVRIIFHMLPGVGIATYVAEPDIKACISQNETQTVTGAIGNPVSASTQQPMLEEYDRPGSI